jgi:putative FmdB family regulatory protein
MPLYEYECPECGERVEVLQKAGEDGAALKCQKCAISGLRKVLSGCVVKTKGSGKTACALGGNSGAGGFT